MEHIGGHSVISSCFLRGERNLKRTICFAFVILLLLSGCTAAVTTQSPAVAAQSPGMALASTFPPSPPVGEGDLEPPHYLSYNEFESAVRNADPKAEFYNLAGFEYYYIPAYIVSRAEAKLDIITVKSFYAALSYKLRDIEYPKKGAEAEVLRASNTIQFVWYRQGLGAKLLQNIIANSRLKQLDDSGLYYYQDIDFTGQVTGKSIYWVRDGYCFQLDIPIDLFEELMGDAKETGLMSETLQKITSIEKVKIEK